MKWKGFSTFPYKGFSGLKYKGQNSNFPNKQ